MLQLRCVFAIRMVSRPMGAALPTCNWEKSDASPQPMTLRITWLVGSVSPCSSHLKSKKGPRQTRTGMVTCRMLWKCAACKKGFAVTAGIRPKGSTIPRFEWLLTTQEPGRKVRSSPGGNMYADAVAKITESMFPIFFDQPQGNLPNVGVRGTGFFLDDSGLFLTADHVITRAPTGSTLYYYGKVPDEVCEPAVEIEHVASDPAQDLYLGRVSRDYLQPVELSNEPVRPGNSVCLSGYPMAVLAISPQGGLVGNVRRYWQPTFVIDVTQAVIGNRTYDGYIVQHSCLAGMSGGPVFDMDGNVRGMAGATLTRTIPEHGDPTVVPNGIVIDVEHIRGFLEASRSCRSTRN